MIYPDLAFTLSLLVAGDQTAEASALLREAPHPVSLSLLHRLQIENALLRALRKPASPEREMARQSLLLWQQYLREEVFSLQRFDLEAAFALAASWNAAFLVAPPRWGHLLHPALAGVTGGVFASFDPALRKLAAAEGLALLPGKL